MIEISVTNAKNETLMLTGNEQNFQLINVEGLNPPETAVNLSTLVGVDGAKLNSLRGETRNIVLNIRINGDVESNRLKLYRYFNRKQAVNLHFTTEQRSVDIIGYIDTFNCDLFTNSEIAQISVICPNPYFTAVADDVYEISALTKLFKFPFAISSPIPLSEVEAQTSFTINNSSSIPVGIKVYVKFYGSVNSVVVTNGDQTMTITYNFVADDILEVNTKKGEKSVTLIREGIEYNVLSILSGDYIQLETGINTVAFAFDNIGNVENANFSFRKVYEAI